MKQMKPKHLLDRSVVTARAEALAKQGQTKYWIVLSMRDGLDLLYGKVSADVRTQVIKLVHQDVAETKEEYVARLSQGCGAEAKC